MELIIFNLLLAISSSFFAAYIVLSRPHRRARFISLLMIGSSLWCYGYALEMYFTDLPTKLFWAKIQVLGMMLTNVWPLFVAHFIGKESLTGKKGVLMISFAPVLILGSLLTDNGQGLIFSSVAINYLGKNLPLLKSYGVGLSLFFLYSYALIFGSNLYAIKSVHEKFAKSSRIIYTIALSATLPVLSHIYFIFISKSMYFDYTPTVFGLVSMGLILFAPSEVRIGNVMPIEFANILGKMDDVVILTDQRNQITHLNPAARKIISDGFDIAEDNIAGRRLDDFLGENVDNYSEAIRSEIEIGGKYYDVSIFTIPDWRGRPSTVCRILREVTERVSLERKLRSLHLYASEISMAKSFEDVGTITANALRNSLGYSEGLLIITENGKLVLKQVWGPIQQIANSDYLMEEMSRLGSFSYSRFREFLDEIGHKRECISAEKALMSTPIFDEGVQKGVICIFRETDVSFSENERMLLEIFGNHIASAIHGIHHDIALMKSQKAEIENIMEGASRVASMVRHDLRGPLQTIRNASYIIEQDIEKSTKMTTIINKSVDYMNRIVEDLAYTDNIGRYNMMELNMNTLIQQTLVQLLIPKNIEVIKVLYPEPLVGSFDKIKVQRMLNNLLRNAVEAMPEGGRLTIASKRGDSEIMVVIEDTGMGIKEMEKLFIPFTSSKLNGMGLGLVSVKKTIEAHNGTIRVESSIGKGTKFTLLFPLLEDQTGSNATKLNSITVT